MKSTQQHRQAIKIMDVRFKVAQPTLYRAKAEPYDHYAVKDLTIVYSGGRYHMFYTGANAGGTNQQWQRQ